jgi:hypothetical protein
MWQCLLGPLLMVLDLKEVFLFMSETTAYCMIVTCVSMRTCHLGLIQILTEVPGWYLISTFMSMAWCHDSCMDYTYGSDTLSWPTRKILMVSPG